MLSAVPSEMPVNCGSVQYSGFPAAYADGTVEIAGDQEQLSSGCSGRLSYGGELFSGLIRQRRETTEICHGGQQGRNQTGWGPRRRYHHVGKTTVATTTTTAGRVFSRGYEVAQPTKSGVVRGQGAEAGEAPCAACASAKAGDRVDGTAFCGWSHGEDGRPALLVMDNGARGRLKMCCARRSAPCAAGGSCGEAGRQSMRRSSAYPGAFGTNAARSAQTRAICENAGERAGGENREAAAM